MGFEIKKNHVGVIVQVDYYIDIDIDLGRWSFLKYSGNETFDNENKNNKKKIEIYFTLNGGYKDRK